MVLCVCKGLNKIYQIHQTVHSGKEKRRIINKEWGYKHNVNFLVYVLFGVNQRGERDENTY